MDTGVLRDCNELAFQNKIAFPEYVRRLDAVNVERYCANLVRLDKIYYSSNGQVHTEHMPLKNPPVIAESFMHDQVKAAISQAQQRKIDYPEFLRRIMSAGVVYYDVFVKGRKTIYTGRNGDFHVENFPSNQ